jgi:hypothetical protein
MVETIGFPVTANQSSAGDYLPIDSDTLAGCTVTNSSAYAVEYSTGGAWTTIAAGGSATINTGAIATTSLRFRKKTGDSIPVVLSVAVTHPGTIPAQLVTDAGGNAIGLSGGAPQAGVAFGPPSTIFRLRMRCTGGAATVTVVATKRSGGSDTYTFSLASGGDVSEPMYADDYSSLVWTKSGSGSVTVEVI